MTDKLTPAIVRKVVGPITDDKVAEIIATGADEGELVSAMAWMNEDDVVGGATHSFVHGRVELLCEILKTLAPEDEDDRPA